MQQGFKFFLLGILISLFFLIGILAFKFLISSYQNPVLVGNNKISSPQPISNLEKNETAYKISKKTSQRECPKVSLPLGYTIAKNNDFYIFLDLFSPRFRDTYPMIFKIDFDGDGETEDVRVLVEKSDKKPPYFLKGKPVIIQVLGKKDGCFQEVFRFDGQGPKVDDNFFGWRNGNEIGYVAATADFWGDGKSAFVFMPISTAYGSGHVAYLNILVFRQGRYQIIEGPTLSELSNFRFSPGAAPGRIIWVATGMWEGNEGYFDPHRCQLDRWVWQNGSYKKEIVGTTKQKYAKCEVKDVLGEIERW